MYLGAFEQESNDEDTSPEIQANTKEIKTLRKKQRQKEDKKAKFFIIYY